MSTEYWDEWNDPDAEGEGEEDGTGDGTDDEQGEQGPIQVVDYYNIQPIR
jgi:hypothetical protein